MPLKDESLFWKKKEFISFLLSILVFFIHSYFAKDNVGTDLISVINQKTSYFFSRSITQFAVPMFFMLSGISFFKRYDTSKYIKKIKSRIFTLIIPYLLWNTIWMLWEIFCSYSFISKLSEDGNTFPLTLSSILKGIFFYECNRPFWFMFNLIIFTLAAPIVFLIIKNKYVAIILISAASVLSVFGIHLPTGIFYYPNSIIFFVIGAVIGYHYFDFISKKSSKTTRIISLIFLSAYILAKNIVPNELYITNYLIEVIVFTFCAFAFWNVVDLFIEKIKPHKIYKRSFPVYAMHLNISIIILKILSFTLHQTQWLEIPKFIVMIISTLVIINLVCSFLEKFLPKIYGILFGNRIKN